MTNGKNYSNLNCFHIESPNNFIYCLYNNFIIKLIIINSIIKFIEFIFHYFNIIYC